MEEQISQLTLQKHNFLTKATIFSKYKFSIKFSLTRNNFKILLLNWTPVQVNSPFKTNHILYIQTITLKKKNWLDLSQTWGKLDIFSLVSGLNCLIIAGNCHKPAEIMTTKTKFRDRTSFSCRLNIIQREHLKYMAT